MVTKAEKTPLSAVDCIPGSLKKSGGRYYFIPSAFKSNYQRLCLTLLQSASEMEATEPTESAPKPQDPLKSLERTIKEKLNRIENRQLLPRQ